MDLLLESGLVSPCEDKHGSVRDDSEAILRANALSKTYNLERSQVGAAGARVPRPPPC